jgi:hypothetical protein
MNEFKPKDPPTEATALAPYPVIRCGGPTIDDAANDAWGSKKQDKVRNEKRPLPACENEYNFFSIKFAEVILKFLIPVAIR